MGLMSPAPGSSGGGALGSALSGVFGKANASTSPDMPQVTSPLPSDAITPGRPSAASVAPPATAIPPTPSPSAYPQLQTAPPTQPLTALNSDPALQPMQPSQAAPMAQPAQQVPSEQVQSMVNALNSGGSSNPFGGGSNPFGNFFGNLMGSNFGYGQNNQNNRIAAGGFGRMSSL